MRDGDGKRGGVMKDEFIASNGVEVFRLPNEDGFIRFNIGEFHDACFLPEEWVALCEYVREVSRDE